MTPMKQKPPDKDCGVLTGGFSSMRAGDRLVKVNSWQGFACGFDSRPALCRRPRQELTLLPGLQTGTAETVRPSNLSIRLSACPNKEGHADEPTRRTRPCAC